MTGFGYFYCPLLPWMTTIILVITFYLQYYISLRHNCANSKKTWTNAKTRTLYMIISFVYMLFPSFIFIYFISLYEVTSNCGPFEAGRPPIYVTGIITEDRQVSFWLFNSPVWAGITGWEESSHFKNVSQLSYIQLVPLCSTTTSGHCWPSRGD